MANTLKRSAAAGIVCEILYFASVTLFLVTKAELALTLWEIMTVGGAAVMLITMTAVSDAYRIKPAYRTLMLISLSGTVFITSIAHFTSIGVVRVLSAQGADIPDYFKIGTFPSIEMTLDYTAWGLFMGCAFLMMLLGISDRTIRIFSAVCAALCFTGFTGSFFLDALWYPAPLGYGAGFLIMCIYVLKKAAKPTDETLKRSE